jgi:signal peptidase I
MDKARALIREVAEEVKDAINSGTRFVFSVQGRSMHPTMINGEIVHIGRFDIDKAKPGDILLFKYEETLAVHRLVFILEADGNGEQKLVTAGDGLLYIDKTIDVRDVLGKVEFIERNGRLIDVGSLKYRLLGLVRVFLARHPSIRAKLRNTRQRAVRLQER